MKWNSKKILLMICVGLTGSALFSFNKGDDRNFQIAKNLDIFNAIFKELDMFYVDTIDPEKVIKIWPHAFGEYNNVLPIRYRQTFR